MFHLKFCMLWLVHCKSGNMCIEETNFFINLPCRHSIVLITDTTNTVFTRIEAPGAKTKFWWVSLFKNQRTNILLLIADCNNGSTHKRGLRLWARTLNIPSHFCHPRVFRQDIDSMWHNVTVNRCKVKIFNLFPSKSRGCFYSRGCLNSNKYVMFVYVSSYWCGNQFELIFDFLVKIFLSHFD